MYYIEMFLVIAVSIMLLLLIIDILNGIYVGMTGTASIITKLCLKLVKWAKRLEEDK